MIRIGTRGSALALAQANAVGARLGEHELLVVTTAGDLGEAVGDKARWTSTLERALIDGEIDVAVHSAKDVPGGWRRERSSLPYPDAEIRAMRSAVRLGLHRFRSQPGLEPAAFGAPPNFERSALT